jgi:hypothetical protein
MTLTPRQLRRQKARSRKAEAQTEQRRLERVVYGAIAIITVAMFVGVAAVEREQRGRYALLIVGGGFSLIMAMNMSLNLKYHGWVSFIGIGTARRAEEPAKYWLIVAIVHLPLLILFGVGVYLAFRGR